MCTIDCFIELLLVIQSRCFYASACPGIAHLCPEILLLGPLCCLPCPQHIPKLREVQAAQALGLWRCKQSVLWFGIFIDPFPAHGISEASKGESAVLS